MKYVSKKLQKLLILKSVDQGNSKEKWKLKDYLINSTWPWRTNLVDEKQVTKKYGKKYINIQTKIQSNKIIKYEDRYRMHGEKTK